MKKILGLMVVAGLLCVSGYAQHFEIESTDAEDGFVRSDGFAYADVIRIGAWVTNGYLYDSFVSFDTTVLDGVTIDEALLRLTRSSSGTPWDGAFTNPDVDPCDFTVDLSTAFNGNTDLEANDYHTQSGADVADCAVGEATTDWSFSALAQNESVEIPLNAAAIAAINTAGRTQLRIVANNFPSDATQAAIDCYDGGSGENSPILVINPALDVDNWDTY